MIIITYIVAFFLTLLALFPPIQFEIPLVVNSFFWCYGILMCGATGIYLINSKFNLSLKILMLYLFTACFLSTGPYLSFNNYIVITICFLLFLLIRRCEDRIIIDTAQTIFFFQLLLITLQLFRRDPLMNFEMDLEGMLKALGGTLPPSVSRTAWDGNHIAVNFGTIFQDMRLGSLLAILSPFLLVKSRWFLIPIGFLMFISGSSAFAMSIVVGILVYAWLKIKNRSKYFIVLGIVVLGAIYGLFIDRASWSVAFTDGRIPNWIRIFGIGMQHPFIGYGMSTFAPLYKVIIKEVAPFAEAHNCWLQIWWELGLIGLSLILTYAGSLIYRLYKAGRYEHLAGLFIIAGNMFLAFPTRQTQTALLIVTYVALCEKQLIKKEDLCLR